MTPSALKPAAALQNVKDTTAIVFLHPQSAQSGWLIYTPKDLLTSGLVKKHPKSVVLVLD